MSVTVHLSLGAHHHAHSHESEHADALRAAAHGHHHEIESDGEHQHEARLSGNFVAQKAPVCGAARLVEPRSDRRRVTELVGDASRVGPTPLAFLTNCSWLL
jgi:hypothetical protein